MAKPSVELLRGVRLFAAVDDRFLERVVPAIASASPDEQIPTDDVLAGFLKINRELRQKNNQFVRELEAIDEVATELGRAEATKHLATTSIARQNNGECGEGQGTG